MTKTGTLEADVVEQYKNLADIERGFRVLKSDIETGPVYHRLLEQLRGIQHQAANLRYRLAQTGQPRANRDLKTRVCSSVGRSDSSFARIDTDLATIGLMNNN